MTRWLNDGPHSTDVTVLYCCCVGLEGFIEGVIPLRIVIRDPVDQASHECADEPYELMSNCN